MIVWERRREVALLDGGAHWHHHCRRGGGDASVASRPHRTGNITLFLDTGIWHRLGVVRWRGPLYSPHPQQKYPPPRAPWHGYFGPRNVPIGLLAAPPNCTWGRKRPGRKKVLLGRKRKLISRNGMQTRLWLVVLCKSIIAICKLGGVC